MKKLDKSKACTAILIILTLATVSFIFSRSIPDIPTSKAESEGVMSFIAPLLELFVGKGNVTIHLVRKLAHFCEFGLLGVEFALLFKKHSLLPFFLSLLVALSDETIQIFSHRGSQVQDVWLDFAGAVTGIVLMWCFVLIVQKIKKRKT